MNKQPTSRPKRRQERANHRERRAAEARRRQRMRAGWAAGGVAALGIIAFVLWSNRSGSAGAGSAVDGVQCNSNEQLVYHIHAHLTIYDAGRPVTVPQSIGIDQKDNCIYWLHTHDTSGVIHVESPTNKQYPLKNFLDIWGQAVNKTSFLTHGITAGHSVRTYVGGSLYHGDPQTVLLTPHKVITLEYGPPWVTPDSSYTFPSGE